MFSVDNFYAIFKSHYGNFLNDQNVVTVFQDHGSKEWNQLTYFVEDVSMWCSTPYYQQLLAGKIVMHDQEPVMIDHIADYRKNVDTDASTLLWNIESVTDVEYLHLKIKSGQIPIICHSEKNSRDIEFLEQNLFITCYYWWHGMIARDWFRHWQYHADLTKKIATNYSYRFLLYARAVDGSRQYRKHILGLLEKHSSKIKYNNNSNAISPDESARIEVNDADCAVHIVAETLFDTEKIHLTEKVFKPMVMNQPFIVYGPPGTLEYLRSYGFATFPGLINESYDQIADHQQRLNFINNEIERLCNLSRNDFNQLLSSCQAAVQHNRQHFFSEKFQQDLIQELSNNMQIALIKQDHMSKDYPGGSWLWVNQQLIAKNVKRSAHWINAIAEQKQWYQENDPKVFEKIQTLYPDVFK